MLPDQVLQAENKKDRQRLGCALGPAPHISVPHVSTSVAFLHGREKLRLVGCGHKSLPNLSAPGV
jgi:hypothetical protein